MEYYSDYPKRPIGGSNPYYCCASCGRSDPQINGQLDGHYDFCEWAKQKRKELEDSDTDYKTSLKNDY